MRTDNQQEDVPWWAIELGCWTMVVLSPILTWGRGQQGETGRVWAGRAGDGG